MTICLAYGRGKDLDGDVTIAEAEGSQPTKRVLPGRDEPTANQLHGRPGTGTPHGFLADPAIAGHGMAGARWLGAPGVS